jgi:predicted ATPase/DNA-binding winged helix-turn-helix (wHTH) protein
MSIETIQMAGGLELQFGPFRLFPQQRLLLHSDTPLRLGSRARDILFALVERAGEIVMKNDLIARVWPNTIVEEGTLRVHVNSLRRALGCGKAGVRYVENVTGRGYLFIAPVTRREQTRAPEPGAPVPLTRMIGRDAILSTLTARLTQARSLGRRLLTIVGPGGSGKTTVAANLADRQRLSYPDGARFIDLANCADLEPAAAVAAAFGAGNCTDDPLAQLSRLLRGKQMLLVLDNCERVVGSAAALAENLLRVAPGLHILATSREPLRTQSEWLLHLAPLAAPAREPPLTAERALDFPAIQLFVERAMASQEDFELTDANVAVVVDICRELDGLPLAIELAAARAGLFGMHEIRARVHDPLGLLTKGCRTAPARQQTLRATLDWSYTTLSDVERVAFRRLAIFDRGFDLNSAVMEIADDTLTAAAVTDSVANLAAKSLLVRQEVDGRAVYRFLTTTRAYALEKLESFL